MPKTTPSDNKQNVGYVHVYTGNGKGKTTAAFGLALRALMAGKTVFVGQFVKSLAYHETKIAEALAPKFTREQLRIEQFGNGCFIYSHEPTQTDIDMAVRGFEECREILSAEGYDVVILDEITIALRYKLLDVETVVRAVRNRNPRVEVVLTGRYAPDALIELGDVVTEMTEVKHYFKTKGVQARDGIER